VTNQERARGALLGLAVGDVLGTTLEFSTPRELGFRPLLAGPHDDITGRGPWGLAPGQVTDDTQMACCLLASLRACVGFHADDAGRRYVEWRTHAFDIGSQTHAALDAIDRGVPAHEAGRHVWETRGRNAAGNGSLMRTAPIGVWFAEDPATRRAAALSDSAITHYDPRYQLACAAFDAAIATALHGPTDPGALVVAARAEIDAAAAALGERDPGAVAETEAARRALCADLDAAGRDDPRLYGPDLHLHRHAGFVRVAFRLAFWEALHAPSFGAGLVDAVNRGGDADTNGAIAGALLGACHGEQAIPDAWSDRVLGALQQGPPGPLRDVYHPLRLLELHPQGPRGAR